MDAYYTNYFFLGILLVIAIIFPLLPLGIARIVAPRKPSKQKQDIYECGLESKGDAWVQFKVQYYIYGIIFLVFDVEMVFLFPWAIAYNQLGGFAFAAGLVFIFLLADALVYAVKKNALEWA